MTDLDLTLLSESGESERGLVKDEPQKTGAKITETKNIERDAASIYMGEITNSVLLDYVGEINISRRIELHKNSCLLFLLLIPSVRTLFFDNYMADKARVCGHPKIIRYGVPTPESTAAGNYPDELTDIITSIKECGDACQDALTAVDIGYVSQLIKGLTPLLPVFNKNDVDQDFFHFKNINAVHKELSKKRLPKQIQVYLKAVTRLFTFNVDYYYINKLFKFAKIDRDTVYRCDNKFIDINQKGENLSKKSLITLLKKTISTGKNLSLTCDPSLKRKTMLAQHDAEKALDKLGLSYLMFKTIWPEIVINNSQGAQAISEMTNSNLRLVLYTAKNYNHSSVEFLDFVQEGNIGLMRAVEKFDYRKGYKFSTYATWWIRQAITRAISEQGKLIRIPVHMLEIIKQVDRARKEYIAIYNLHPAAEIISQNTGLPLDKVKVALQVDSEPISFEKPVSTEDDNSALINYFAYEDDTIVPPSIAKDNQDLRDVLLKAISKLPPRDAKIIIMRWGLHSCKSHTLEEAGVQFDVTRERIRQLEYKSLARLKDLLHDYYHLDK